MQNGFIYNLNGIPRRYMLTEKETKGIHQLASNYSSILGSFENWTGLSMFDVNKIELIVNEKILQWDRNGNEIRD